MLLKWVLKKLQELLINSNIAPVLWDASCFCVGLQDSISLGYISHVHVLNMENLDKEVWGRKCKWPMVSSSRHNDLIFCCISSHCTFRQFRWYYKQLVSCFLTLFYILIISLVIKCPLKVAISILWYVSCVKFYGVPSPPPPHYLYL